MSCWPCSAVPRRVTTAGRPGSVTSLTASMARRSDLHVRFVRKHDQLSGSLTNFFRYTGRELDTETNLYYYRARYHDPASGRFVSEDPGRFPLGSTFTPTSRMTRVISLTRSGSALGMFIIDP